MNKLKSSILLVFLLVFYPFSVDAVSFYRMKPLKGSWGAKVTIYGKGFKKNKVKVYYSNKLLRPVKVTYRVIVVKVPEGAKNGWFEVEQDGRRLRAPSLFVIENKPVVLNVSPLKTIENSWISVKGKFLDKTAFYLDFLKLKTKVLSSSEVKIFIPKGAKNGRIYYKPPFKNKIKTKFLIKLSHYPVITGVYPPMLDFKSKLTVKGRNFCKNPEVYVGKLKMKIIKKTSVAIKGFFPSGTVKINSKVVIRCYGKSFRSENRVIIIPKHGKVIKVKPTFGFAESVVYVYGSNFSKSDRFWIGSMEIKNKKFISETEFRLKIPKHAVSGNIYYRSKNDTVQTDFMYRVVKRPVITGFTPSKGWYGTKVEIKGKNLCHNFSISLSGKRVRKFRWLSPEKIIFNVPAHAKTAKILIKCIIGNGAVIRVSTPSVFKVAVPEVTVTNVTPPQGPPGTEVIINGTNFPRDLSVKLGNKLLKTEVINSTTAKVKVDGFGLSRLVLYAYGKAWATNRKFKVLKLKPSISSISPLSVLPSGIIKIKGRNFCLKPRVTLVSGGKIKTLEVKNVTPELLTVGLQNIVKGGFVFVRCYNYKVKSSQTIKIKQNKGAVDSVYPLQGPPGTLVTVKGRRLSKALFYIGKKRIQTIKSTDKKVVLRIPEGIKTGRFKIKLSLKKRPKNLPFTFSVKYPKPVINSISSDMGWIKDKLEIKGRNFCKSVKVVFSGNRFARIISRVSHTYLKIEIPAGARSGHIKVVCPGVFSESSEYFTMAPPYSRVTSVSPLKGCPGDVISINGVNFTKRTKFYIGNRLMIKNLLKPRHALVMIPKGARSGDVKVESFGKKIPSTYSIIIKSRICKSRKR